MTIPNPYREAVQRGAALLDEHKPGWRDVVRNAIANDSLDMDDREHCVLGHVYAGTDVGPFFDPYTVGIIELRAITGHDEWGDESGADLGFALQPDNEGSAREQYALLTGAWRETLAVTS